MVEKVTPKRFPNGATKLEDGLELFSVPEGTDVWFEDLEPPQHGFVVHLNPKPEEISPKWSRTWPPETS